MSKIKCAKSPEILTKHVSSTEDRVKGTVTKDPNVPQRQEAIKMNEQMDSTREVAADSSPYLTPTLQGAGEQTILHKQC